MVSAATAAGVEGASVLEIGGGIGKLQAEVILAGAVRGEVVELVAAFEPYADELARRKGIADRTSFRVVDLLEAPEEAEEADLVLLNRVVCCSPDGVVLAGIAAGLTRRRLAMSFPRDLALVRVAVAAQNLVFRVLGKAFRAFVHSPRRARRRGDRGRAPARGDGPSGDVGVRRPRTGRVSDLGLFPLPLVLLPAEQLPLHVFEERYKELVGECLEDDLEFGLVYADDDGIREVGTRAGVVEVLDRFDDGRLNVVVEGRERFRLRGLTHGRSFQTGEVEDVVDDADPAEQETVARALELFEQLRELTGSSVEVPPEGTEQLSFVLAGRVELAPEVKLALLVETSERVRLEQLCEILEGVVAAVRRQRLAAERAASNGRVDLG